MRRRFSLVSWLTQRTGKRRAECSAMGESSLPIASTSSSHHTTSISTHQAYQILEVKSLMGHVQQLSIQQDHALSLGEIVSKFSCPHTVSFNQPSS